MSIHYTTLTDVSMVCQKMSGCGGHGCGGHGWSGCGEEGSWTDCDPAWPSGMRGEETCTQAQQGMIGCLIPAEAYSGDRSRLFLCFFFLWSRPDFPPLPSASKSYMRACKNILTHSLLEIFHSDNHIELQEQLADTRLPRWPEGEYLCSLTHTPLIEDKAPTPDYHPIMVLN